MTKNTETRQKSPDKPDDISMPEHSNAKVN